MENALRIALVAWLRDDPLLAARINAIEEESPLTATPPWLGIAASAPLYVVHLDAETRRVVVGPREALNVRKIQLRDVNWIGGGELDRAIGDGLELFVKVRSTRPARWRKPWRTGWATRMA